MCSSHFTSADAKPSDRVTFFFPGDDGVQAGTAALGTAALGTAALGTAALGTAALGTAALGTLGQGPRGTCMIRWPISSTSSAPSRDVLSFANPQILESVVLTWPMS